jgi:uncharacterized protein (TIGR02757 family)
MNSYNLKKLLDNIYATYKQRFSSDDPVWILHGFNDKKDIEVAGLICACYCYGSIEQIKRFVNMVLNKTGNKPYEFTVNFSKRKDKKYLKGLYYRFNTDDDLVNLFSDINHILTNYSSLENLFMRYYRNDYKDIRCVLKSFVSGFSNAGRNYLIPHPSGGSAFKRMNLYFRWMIRKDEIDLGLWEGVDKSKLIVPVDVHVARISRKLKLVKRKTVDLKFAAELTENLKEFDPLDPVKYDFALCHAEMEGRVKLCA